MEQEQKWIRSILHRGSRKAADQLVRAHYDKLYAFIDVYKRQEKGRPIEKRQCPKRITKKCVGCQPCSITTGFAGAGAFSDGKLSLSPDVGGNLPEILGYDKTVELLKESDDIYLKFGADTNVYGIDKAKEIQ